MIISQVSYRTNGPLVQYTTEMLSCVTLVSTVNEDTLQHSVEVEFKHLVSDHSGEF